MATYGHEGGYALNPDQRGAHEEKARHHDPPGLEFLDAASQRHMKLVTDGPFKGWICYKHPDGQWVSLRRATEEDREKLAEAIVEDAPPSAENEPSD